MTTTGKTICYAAAGSLVGLVVIAAAAAATLCLTTRGVAWLPAALLGAVWFVAYGVGTTWQGDHERCEGNKRKYYKPQDQEPPYTRWKAATQGFSNGLWAAAGWPAAYALWVLWRDHWRDHPEKITLAAAGLSLGLLVFALMSVTGWLPARLEAILRRG